METWRDVFIKQVSSGRFWRNLFKDNFDNHKFLDRCDAVYICKKAQSDVYDKLIKKFSVSKLVTIVQELENEKDAMWREDISGLGQK